MGKRWTWIVFLLALTVRLVFLAFVYDGPNSLHQPDSPAFEQPARGLVEYGVIGLPQMDGATPEPFTERVPGYILFLAALLIAWPSSIAVALVQAVLDSITCVAISAFARQVAPRLGPAAGLVAALAPNMVIQSSQILSDSLFLLPFTLFLTASLRATSQPLLRHAALAGLWLGIATLIRPVPWILIGLMPVVLAVMVRGWRHRIKLAATMLSVALITITPWLARNAIVAGHWQLASQTGVHALYWVVPLTREYGAGTSPDQTKALMNERLSARLAAQGRSALPENPFEASSIMNVVAKEALLESGVMVMARAWVTGAVVNLLSPAIVAAPPVQHMARPSFYDTAGGTIGAKMANYMAAAASTSYFWVMAAGLVGTALARLLQLAGLVAAMRGGWSRQALVISAVVFLYFLAVTGPITGVKYRLPLEPILVLLLAEGSLHVLGWLRRRRP